MPKVAFPRQKRRTRGGSLQISKRKQGAFRLLYEGQKRVRLSPAIGRVWLVVSADMGATRASEVKPQ